MPMPMIEKLMVVLLFWTMSLCADIYFESGNIMILGYWVKVLTVLLVIASHLITEDLQK